MAATLVSIDSAVSLLTNKVNTLVELFTAGGVVNPDLAVLKADIQSDYNTKFANYAKLSASNTFTNDVFMASGVYSKRNVNTLESMDWTSSNTVWSFAFRDSRNITIGDAMLYVNKGSNGNFGTSGIEFRLLPSNVYGNSEDALVLGIGYSPVTGIAYGKAPKYLSDLTDNTNKIVTTAFLNSIGNSVVHTSGDETLAGTKTFTGTVATKNLKYVGTSAQTVVPAANVYLFEHEIQDSTKTRVARDHIVVVKDKGTMQRWLDLEAYGPLANGQSAPNSFQINMYALANTSVGNVAYIPSDATAYMSVEGEFITAGIVSPMKNNMYDLGMSNYKWRNVYCASGAFNGSDERIKDDIAEIPEAVFRAWAKVDFCQYKFKDAIAEKGENARLHIGLIAQRVIEAFQSEGLDATVYGLVGYSSWEEKTFTETESISSPVYEDVEVVVPATYITEIDSETGEERKVVDQDERRYVEQRIVKEAEVKERTVTTPAGDLYMLRYDECLALECAYQRYVLNQIKAKLGI